MAEQRTPGPLDGSRGNRDLRDGTLQLRPGMTPGVIGGPVPVNTGLWDTFVKGAERIDAVSDAIQVGRQRAGAAILKETGHALEEVVKGLIPGLLLMMVTLVATTVIGGAIGAAVGFLAGGVGAAPGAVIGADLGFSAGMSILTWLGLGFLAVTIAQGFGELIGAVSHATTHAWEAPDSPRTRAEIEAAGDEYAYAIALLFKFILMAIVLRLAGPASRGLIEQLRKSKLGEGFANWVVANREALLNNPKLRPRPKAVVSEKPVEPAVTPSQAKNANPDKKTPPPPKSRTERLNELASDPAQGGKVTPKTMREAEVGLSLEEQGKLPGPITRDPTGASEFIDASGQKWDVKGFNSQYAPKGYNTPAAVQKIGAEVAAGENVIVDTAKMSAEHVTELQNALGLAGLSENVIFF